MLDDQLYSKKGLVFASDVFIRGRHTNTSIILISQSIFFNEPNYRICMQNSTHCVLFKSRSIKPVKLFGRSFLEDKKIENFVKLYRKNVIKKKYGYLLVDFDKDIEENPLAIRSDIAGEDKYQKCYLL